MKASERLQRVREDLHCVLEALDLQGQNLIAQGRLMCAFEAVLCVSVRPDLEAPDLPDDPDVTVGLIENLVEEPNPLDVERKK